MSDLRVKLIEAGARERYERMVARMVAAADPKLMLLPAWDELDMDDRDVQRGTAAVYLDAFLDCLAENADEWIYAEAKMPKPTPMSWYRQRKDQLERLLDVLRGDTREDTE